MTNAEIFDILKTSKKYSNLKYDYYNSIITYTIDDREYNINLRIASYKKCIFLYENSDINISPISYGFLRNNNLANLPLSHLLALQNNILSKFSKVIKFIKVLDNIIINKNLIFEKCKLIIMSYIKNEYSIEVNNEDLKISLPKTSVKVKRKYKTIDFDVTKEDPKQIIYNISFSKRQNKLYTNMDFKYSIANNNLSIVRRDQSFRELSNDITKIIRSEKLKKIALFNETI